jgi:hypothetical protein
MLMPLQLCLTSYCVSSCCKAAVSRVLACIWCSLQPSSAFRCALMLLSKCTTISNSHTSMQRLMLYATTGTRCYHMLTAGDGNGVQGLVHRCLTAADALAQSPRVNPDSTKLVWLSRAEGFDTHSGAFRLLTGSFNHSTTVCTYVIGVTVLHMV